MVPSPLLWYHVVMSIVSQILREDPDAFYVLSGAAPYVDLSRRRLSNTSPTVTRVAVSPARGILETVNLAAAATLTLHKAPAADHTLMALTKPLTALSTNLLSFYAGDTEGLWQAGNTINFGVTHVGGGTTVVSYTIDSSRTHLIAGVAQTDKIILYVDGFPVVSKDITNTNAFGLPSQVILGDPNAAIHALAAVWHRALTGSEIAGIWKAANPAPLRTYALSQLFSADLRLDTAFSDTEEFLFDETDTMLQTSVTVTGTTVAASYDGTLTSIAGNVRFPLPFVSTTTGIRFSWGDANGAVVKYSLDGTTFTSVYNGQTVEAGTSITSQPIVEVSFPAGSTANMYLVDLVASRQITGNLTASLSNGRTVAMAGSISLTDNSDFRKYPSLPSTFGTNGTLTIAPETEDPTINTYAIEFWYTPVAADLTGTKVLLDNTPVGNYIYFISGKINYNAFSAFYVNKASTTTNTYTLVPGVPIHIVAVYATPNNSQIKLGWTSNPAQGNLSNAAMIFQSVIQADVNALYDNQQDVPVTRPTSTSSIAVTDTGTTNLGLVWSGGSQ